MKFQGHEIELVIVEDEFNDNVSLIRTHTLRYVKTPRGQRKDLIVVQEDFKRKLCEVDCYSQAKTAQERKKLLSFFLGREGGRAAGTKFHSKTTDLLRLSFVAGFVNFWVRFDDS